MKYDETDTKGKKVEFSTMDILAHVRPSPIWKNDLLDEEKHKKIMEHFQGILETLGLDPKDESIQRTPHRVAQMYIKELFSGLDPKNFPKVTVVENSMHYDQMIIVKNINMLSICEHHFLPIQGRAQVAYIPKNRVIGLSKINRIVRYFARRPQIQERLSMQVGDCLSYVLDTEDVAVYIEGKHFCVVARGIEDINSVTATSDLRGAFKTNSETRSEFLRVCS